MFIQAEHDEQGPLPPDGSASRASSPQLLSDVDLHDVQRVVVPGCRCGICGRLLPVRMEEIVRRRHNRTLPLSDCFSFEEIKRFEHVTAGHSFQFVQYEISHSILIEKETHIQ